MTEDSYVLQEFYKAITTNKIELFERIAAARTRHITAVIEDVYQEHNASAVIRSCECLGIQDIHTLEKRNKYAVNKDIALGAANWVDIHQYYNNEKPVNACIKNLRERNFKLVGTSPHSKTKLEDLDVNEPLALFFGTEQDGLSKETLLQMDEQIKIPMFGFTESYNISVSVAMVILDIRTRLENSNISWKLSKDHQTKLKIKWCTKILHGGDFMESIFRKRFLEKEF